MEQGQTGPEVGRELGAEAEPSHHALVNLHLRSGAVGGVTPGLLPGFRAMPTGTSLRLLAEAPEDEVPVSARLHVLHNLAQADFPDYESSEAEYRALAASVAQARNLGADQVLDDLKLSARENLPFARTTSGQAMRHGDVAFIGEQVCHTRTVDVGGLRAAWIFSEFETDATFEHVVDWIDPRSWPQRGPLLFKRMEIVGAQEPVDIVDPGGDVLGDEHWHGMFHEEVQLVQRVNTLLHCDYWRDGTRAAGMTYDLGLSLDNQIDVDRGFLSVTDEGQVRRVRALKIVGFTDDAWDTVAELVCPFWTDWVRGAVEKGSTSTPRNPTHTPTGEGTTGGSPDPLGDTLAAWLEFFGDSARAYLDLFNESSDRATSGSYSPADWMADGGRYWSQLAKDWARAWSHGLEALEEIAREGLDAGLTPPGTPRATGRGAASAMVSTAGAAATSAMRATTPTPADKTTSGTTAASATVSASQTAAAPGEGTTIPVPQLAAGDRPECSRLVSIEAGGTTIPADSVSVTVVELPGGSYGARVATTDTTVPSGLYVGRLLSPDGAVLAPVQLYLSRAARVDGS